MPIYRRHILLFPAAVLSAALAGNGRTAGSEEAADANNSSRAPAEKVLGIGGLFFRATDPDALALWYRDNLGIALTPSDYDAKPWRTEAGTTIFAPFKRDTKYFGAKSQMWMINFRVRDLDKIAAQLRSKGISVNIDPKTYPNGRFARLQDPEGNPIELWQPAAGST